MFVSCFFSFSQNTKYFTLFLIAWFLRSQMFLYKKGFFFFFFFPFRLICCSLKTICLGVACGMAGRRVGAAFILFNTFWVSWICGFLSDTNLGKILSHYGFKYCFCSFLSYSPDFLTIYMRGANQDWNLALMPKPMIISRLIYEELASK